MYKTINGYTKAKMIEMIKTKMLDHVSKDPHKNHCAYKAKDGNRCVVGVFMPDNHRGLKSISNIHGLLETYVELFKYMPIEVKGLNEMQTLHDGHIYMHHSPDPRPALINWIETNVEDSNG